MRSDAEIRSEVETRLKRRGLLVVNGGLYLLSGLFFYFYIRTNGFFNALGSYLFFFMLAWTGILLLHILRVAFVEMRERLVRSAIERERQFYLLRDNFEKQKRSEGHDYDDSRLRIADDDGELVDYPAAQKVKADDYDS